MKPFMLVILSLVIAVGCRNGEKANQSKGNASNDKNQKETRSSQDKKDKDESTQGDNGPSDFEFVWRKETGVDFVHCSGFDDQRVFPAANGSGIGVVDFDLDGLADLYFASGKHFPVDKPAPGNTNQFFRNLGNWSFDQCSSEAHLDADAYCSGITVGDFDNDGFQDVYVGCYGVNLLYHNLGDGSFELMKGTGLPHGKPEPLADNFGDIPDTPGWATSSVFLDFDGDGDLDIYVGNYGIWNLELKNKCGDFEKNEPRFCSPTSVRAQADVLYENKGDGTFVDVSAQAGIYAKVKNKNQESVLENYRTQGVIATDFNADGLIDIYCGNDMDSNLLLINLGNGKFENRTEMSSTGYGPNGGSLASMGVAASDATNDGMMDLFCTNFSEEYNSFYKGLGDLQFAEVSKQNRLGEGARPWVGWGTEFVDLDCDGWLDVIVTNGHVDPNIKVFEKSQDHLQPCLIWKNTKGRFKLSAVKGEYFAKRHPGRALALADLDNDGDQDVIVGHQDQKPALLENVCKTVKSERNLTVQMIGTRSNRDGIGSVLRFKSDFGQLNRVLSGGGSYLSNHSTVIRETRWDPKQEATVIWRDGRESLLSSSRYRIGNRIYVVELTTDQ